MNKYKSFLIVYFGIIGCSFSNRDSHLNESIDNKTEVELTVDTSSTSNLLTIDTSLIEGISLLNSTPLLSSLDTIAYYYESKFLLFDNNNILVMHGNLGGKKNTYSYFDLYQDKDAYKNCDDGNVPFSEIRFSKLNFSLAFKTENGIKLGMSKGEIVDSKGDNFETNKNHDLEILTYQYSDREHIFLQRSNMPIYEMKFYLVNGSLARYSFGFPSI